MIYTTISAIRTCTYYTVLALYTILWAVIALTVPHFLPLHKRHPFTARTWSQVAIFLCKVICGIKWNVIGKENIPQQPCIVASNHQSSLETYFLQILFSPVAIVLKKEIMKIPFIGRMLRVLHPIPIDRSQKKAAMTQILKMGTKYLEQNIWVTIYPEGTRHPWPIVGKLSKGVCILANKSNKNILPVFHNTGTVSLNNSWIKKPGIITVTIGKPIKSEHKDTKQIHNELEHWMHAQLENYIKKES